jgi:hypothetical protein
MPAMIKRIGHVMFTKLHVSTIVAPKRKSKPIRMMSHGIAL